MNSIERIFQTFDPKPSVVQPMKTYVVKDAVSGVFLGFVGLEEEFRDELSHRENTNVTNYDIRFDLVTGDEEAQVWDEEIIPPIRTVEQFDRWMNGSIV